MKLLEADRSATVAWSPVPGHASYIASGTVAGTMGIDFDTSAHLEIFSVDLNGSSNKQMKVVGKTSTSERFHKLCWGLTGTQQGTFSMGLVAGGLASGVVQVWNPAKIIAQEEDCLVATCERHDGPVQGLDFNPFQHNLLASGGSDSEVFIWDLSNASAPTCYNPGSKTHGQQEAAITCVAWNRKVQRILGSTNHNGVTTLWDLKAKRAVLNFHDPNKKIRCRTMAWNPDEETQLITASEDDSIPVIAVWDLRNTYSPVKELVGHTKGVWSISWCPTDSDLFLSTGKDNKTICWNLKTSEMLCEVDPASQTWNFEVQWSPRIPAILSTCSLEGKINIYSLQDVRNEQPSSLGLASVSPKTVSHPPKWLKRPVGAAFGFGGKLAYFKKHKATEKPTVQIKQISSDADILARASALEKAIAGGVAQLVEYCNNKLESDSEEDKSTWKLLKSLFEENQRTQIHHFLGYNSQSMQKSIQELLTKLGKKPDSNNNESQESITEDTTEKKDSDASELFPDGEKEKGEESEGTIFDSFAQTLQSQLPQTRVKTNKAVIKFPKEHNTEEGLITQALLLGNFEGAVDICIQTQRWGDAFILAAYSGTELFKKTQQVYFASKQAPYLSVMSCIVKDELRELVEQGELSEWKAILAILATYAKAEDFALLVGILGDRLHAEAKDGNAATLCYICAGHLDKTVSIWSAPSAQSKKTTNNTVDVHSLQSLIEKIAVFRKAINHKQPLSPVVLQQYSEYALVLASQGQLKNALTYLSPLLETKPQDVSTSENLNGYILLDRVFHSQKNPAQPSPPFPFKKEEIRGPSTAPSSAAPIPGRQPTSAPGLVPGRQPPSTMTPTLPTPARTTIPSTGLPAPTPGTYVPPQPSRVPATPATYVPPQPSLPTPAGPTFRPPTVTTPTPILPTPTTQPAYQPPTPSHAPLPTPTAHPTFHPPPTMALPTPTPLTPMVPAAPKQAAPPLGPPPIAAPSVATPPPPTSTPPMGPPPTATPVGPPPTGSAPTTKTATKAEPPSNAPTSADNEFVIKSLQSTFDTCSKSTDPKISKLSKDVTKRFEPLLEKLNKNQVSGAVVQLLVQLCTAINNGDSRTAQALNVTLSQDHWEELGSTLLIGFKRLIEMTKN